MIEKTPDFYQKKEEYRKEMREILPSEKQLEYPTEKPEKKLGVPARELLKLRSSEEPEDRFFIENLRLKIKKKLGKELSDEDKNNLQEARQGGEREKKSLEYSFSVILFYEQAIKDSNPYIRSGAAQALAGLAPVNPELASKLYEQAIKDSDPYVRFGAAQALAGLAPVADFSKFSKIARILEKHKISSSENIFSYVRLKDYLAKNEDLGKLLLEDIPAFRAIKEYSLQINSLLIEDKQTKNVEKFWDKNQIRLAKLFNINSEISQNLVNLKLNQFGFPQLEKTLELADGLSLDSSEKIRLLMENTKNADSNYFEKLLELSDAYSRMNLESSFSRQIENLLSKKDLKAKEVIAVFRQGIIKRIQSSP